jgi:hypothetical protein
MPTPDIDAASRFLAAHARVLDRRRFERLFGDGDAQPVIDAVAAYRNADGGFGHALEPDGRAPGSQSAAAEIALRTLHDADAWDERLVAGACEWLERSAPPEGGASGVDPSVEGWPHASWWQPDTSASLITTGQIAGTLHARGVEHRWLAPATELMWQRIDALAGVTAYRLRGILRFLDLVPDRDRATAALERSVAPLIERDGLPDGQAPLELSPLPGAPSRALFGDATIAAELDALAAGQRDDGGWTFAWPAWSPAAEADWRGSVTVDALVILRAHDRLGARAAA